MKRRVVSVLLAVCMCFQMLPVAFADDSITSTVSEQSQEQESTTDEENLPSLDPSAEGESQGPESEDKAIVVALPAPTVVPENTESTAVTPTPVPEATAVPEKEEPDVSETPVPTSSMWTGKKSALSAEKSTTFAAAEQTEEGSTVVGSGACGENLTWTEYSDGHLVIAGTGYMYDYNAYNDYSPWSSDITDVTIADGVTSIGEYAFYGCTGLKSIAIPDSVTSIGEYAFYGCAGLTSIVIPDSITNIGEGVFYDCTGLTSVTIPDSITSIGLDAFYNCSSLTSVMIPDGVTMIDRETFAYCSSLTSVVIPDSVTIIVYAAFSGCSGLTSVTIPDSVTSIGMAAFSGCSGLTSVTIPDSVTSMGDAAFASCTGLTSVTIPDSVTSIRKSVFEDCTGLTSVTIPDSVTSIGEFAFQNCTGLINVTIPDSVTSIGKFAFAGCTGLTNVTIPDSVISMGESAFSDCTGLISVVIPGSVTYLEGATFFNCTGLTSVTISDGVGSIGEFVFDGCTGLKSVMIPDSVHYIGKFAFYSFYCLTDVYFTGSEEEWNAIFVENNNDALLNATIHYNFSWNENHQGPVMYFLSWNEENNSVSFNNGLPLYRVTAETDMSFLENLDSLLNHYVCVAYKVDEGNLENQYTLLSITSVETRLGMMSDSTTTTVTIDGQTYALPEGMLVFPGVKDADVLYHLDENGSLVGFQFLEEQQGELLEVNQEEMTVKIKVSDLQTDTYKISPLAHENLLNALTDYIGKKITVTKDQLNFVYQVAEINHEMLGNHILQTSPKSGSVDVFPVQWNSDNKSLQENMVIDIYFDTPIELSLTKGKIRICDYNTGKAYREIYEFDGHNSLDAEAYVDEEDPTHLSIVLFNTESTTWKASKNSADETDTIPIPYGTKLYVEIEKEALRFKNSNVPFEGITNRDIFNFTTVWGLNPNQDYFGFSNSADSEESPSNESGFRDETHYTVSDAIKNQLYSYNDGYLSLIYQMYIADWNGSCLGMSSVAALHPNALIDLKAWDESANSCYNLAYPKDSINAFGVKDLLNYYQMLQGLNSYPANEVLTTAHGVDKKKTDNLLQTVKNIRTTKEPVIFKIKFDCAQTVNNKIKTENTCHAVLCYGYIESDHEYVLLVYDPSCPNIASCIYIDKENNEFIFKGGWIGEENGKLVSQVRLKELAYINPQDLGQYNIDSMSMNERKRAASQHVLASQYTEPEYATIYVDVNSDFILTNAEGETLEYSGNNLNGTMTVYSDISVGEGNKALYVLKVKPSESFVFKVNSQDSFVGVEQGSNYLGSRVMQANTQVTVKPNVNLLVSGKGELDYTVLASISGNVGEAVLLEGKTQDTVSAQYTKNGHIHLNADDLENVKVKVIQKLQAEESQVDLTENTESPVVGEKIPVRAITSDKDAITLPIGRTEALSVKITPVDATNQAIKWTSSDEEILSVTSDGIVTALNAGKAVITATTVDGGYSVSWNIDGTEPPTLPVTIVPVIDPIKLKRTYTGGLLTVTDLFTIDENAGPAAYILLDGGTGTGSLTEDGNLTVTKAGTFVIQVDTAATDTHAAGSAQVTMTVNKGKGKGTLQVTGSTYPAGVQPAVQGNLSGGSVTYYYNTTDSNQGGSLWTTDTVLDAGEYWMYAEIAATDLYEAYTTSAVPFTVQQAVADQLDLANLITAPVRGATPQTELTTSQFTGTILWSDIPTVFAPETVYTATIKLTAAQNYTLEGLKADSFQYAGAEVHYDPMANQLTIVFPATDGRQVQSFAVTGTPSKATYDLGEAFDVTGLTMTVTYDDGTTETVTSGYRIEPATMAADTTQVVISYGGVKAEPITGLTVRDNLVSIQAPQAITGLANGTEKTTEALGLPKTVKITTSRTQRAIAEADVSWNLDACSYDPAVESEQTFVVQGLVSLPQGMTNLQNVPLTVAVKVTVKAAESKPTEPENPSDTEEKPGASNQPADDNTTSAPTASSNAQPASDDTTKEEQNQRVTVPQTGDPMPITVLVVLMAVSFAGILALSIKRKKDR